MIELNPFAISGLLITIFYFPLFLFILFKGKTLLTRIYSLHIFSIFVWGLGSFLIGINKDPSLALTIWKPSYIGVIFIPVFFHHAVMLITNKVNKFLLLFVYLQAIFFTIMIVSNHLTNATFLILDFYYQVGTTPLFLSSFLIWIVIVSVAHMQLLFYYQTCYPQEKYQIRGLIFAVTGFFGGLSNFFPALGFAIYPYGNFLVPLHSVIVTYAILKHQLFNIRPVIKKGVLYTTLVATISLLYLLIVVIVERLLQDKFKYDSLIIKVTTAFLLGLVFIPLKDKIQHFVDKLFFSGTPEEISALNKHLLQALTESEKYKTLATLSSGIAHEIKNPLTAIKTFTEHLPKKANDKTFVKNFSQIVGKEVNRIDDLIHQLLDYGKPSPLKLRRVDVVRLVEDTLTLLNSQFIVRKIRVAKTYPTKFSFLKLTRAPLDRLCLILSLMPSRQCPTKAI